MSNDTVFLRIMLSQCKMQKVRVNRQSDFEKWTKILSKFQNPKDPMEKLVKKRVCEHNGLKNFLNFFKTAA